MNNVEKESEWSEFWRIVRISIFVLMGICAVGGVLIQFSLTSEAKYYETTDVADYGTYAKRKSAFAQEFITSFFPQEIEASFSDVQYCYRYENVNAHSFEAYLEFTIEDSEEFDTYITSIASKHHWERFPYDDSYWEYSVSNDFKLTSGEPRVWADTGDTKSYNIDYAKIGKILYSAEEQRIVFVAIGVQGWFANTDYFGTFFRRFNIDPIAYEEYATTQIASKDN